MYVIFTGPWISKKKRKKMWRKIIIFNYNSQWTKKHDVNWRLLTQKWYISLWYVVIHLIIDKKHTKKKHWSFVLIFLKISNSKTT